MAAAWGTYRATVMTTQDPAGQGRVRLKVPYLFGDAVTDWAEPHASNGKIPVPGSSVWVLFNGGDPTKPIYLAGSVDLSIYATDIDLAAETAARLAADALLVHLAGTETISGSKTLTQPLGVGANNQKILLTGGATNHGVEIGRTDGVASTPFIDLHSGATAVDFDVRFLVSGGTGVNAGGTVNVQAANFQQNGVTVVTSTDSRLTNARTPTAHATTHQPGGTDAMAVDAVAATGSLRTVGTGALQAAAGNHTHVAQEPTGVVKQYAGSVAPAGYAICDGSALSRTVESALFAVIGTTFGAGDGSTTFNIPDMRDRVAVGVSATTTLGSTGGSANAVAVTHVHSHSHGASSGTISSDHSHSGSTGGQSNDHAHATQTSDQFKANAVASPPVKTNAGVPGDNTYGASADHSHAFTTGGVSANHTHTVTVNTDTTSAGVSGTGANLPPYVGLNYIIKK